jgi:DNA-binding transcriptional ArsR family regulator
MDKKFNSDLLLPESKECRHGSTILKALSHPKKREIIYLIDAFGPITVGTIIYKTKGPASEVHRHLTTLKSTGILNVTVGKNKFSAYTINPARVEQIKRVCKDLLGSE